MSPKFISDSDMTALEASQPKRVISDDEMAQMERAQSPQKQPVADLATQGAAALEGFGQAATAGYLPQIGAAVGALIPNPARTVNEKLKAQGFKIQEAPDNYVTRRDELIRRGESLQKQAPVASAAGSVAGLAAGIPIMGMGAGRMPGLAKVALGTGKMLPVAAPVARLAEAGLQAKGLGLLGRTAQAGAGGAIQAGVMNPGDVEGQINPLQLEQRGEQAKVGGLLGGGLPLAGKIVGGAGSLVGSIPERLKTLGETRGAAALGLFQKHINKMAKESGLAEDKVRELGRFAIKNKLAVAGDEAIDIAKKSYELQKNIGKKIGSLYDEVDTVLASKEISKDAQEELKKTALERDAIANDFDAFVRDKFKNKRQAAEIISAAEKEVEALKSHAKDVFLVRDLQDYKQSLDEVIYSNKSALSAVPPASKEATKLMRDFVKDRMTARIEAIDKAIGNDATKQLKTLNKEYGLAAKASEISNDRVASELGNNMGSLTDKIAAGSGFAAGLASSDSPEDAIMRGALGLSLGGVSKAARVYGRPLATAGALKAGELAEKIPSNLPSVMKKGAGLIQGSPASAGALASRALIDRKNEKRPK